MTLPADRDAAAPVDLELQGGAGGNAAGTPWNSPSKVSSPAPAARLDQTGRVERDR
jgi:hypothetical protein